MGIVGLALMDSHPKPWSPCTKKAKMLPPAEPNPPNAPKQAACQSHTSAHAREAEAAAAKAEAERQVAEAEEAARREEAARQREAARLEALRVAEEARQAVRSS